MRNRDACPWLCNPLYCADAHQGCGRNIASVTMLRAGGTSLYECTNTACFHCFDSASSHTSNACAMHSCCACSATQCAFQLFNQLATECPQWPHGCTLLSDNTQDTPCQDDMCCAVLCCLPGIISVFCAVSWLLMYQVATWVRAQCVEAHEAAEQQASGLDAPLLNTTISLA